MFTKKPNEKDGSKPEKLTRINETKNIKTSPNPKINPNSPNGLKTQAENKTPNSAPNKSKPNPKLSQGRWITMDKDFITIKGDHVVATFTTEEINAGSSRASSRI